MKQTIIALILLTVFSCNSDKRNSSDTDSKTEMSSSGKTKDSEQTTKPESNAEELTKTPNTAFTDNVKDFTPANYYILDKISGTLKNGKEVLVLVLGLKSEKEDHNDTNRTLTILEKKATAYEQMASNQELVMCKSCGGIFGDPYGGIELQGNVLKISNYGGSAWRWSENYTFRYQNDDWKLIGATYFSYYNAKECNGEAGLAGRQLEDINFSTGKMQIVHTEGDNCNPNEDYMKKFGKKTLISFNDFPGKAAQWPSGKVKDGDGQ